MTTREKWWMQRVVLLVLALAAMFMLRPFLVSALGAGVGFVLAAVYLLAYLFAIVFLPLIVFSLARFAYTVFARPFVRVWHINRIRNARHLKEVMQRGKREE
jgi:hypothetical protein